MKKRLDLAVNKAIKDAYGKTFGQIKGIVLYEGPSVLDNQPIVVIATLESGNVKTGNMVQVWILRSDMHPLDAVKTGDDVSICGGCIHRNSSCYVNIGQAPASVYRTYKAGGYITAPDYYLINDLPFNFWEVFFSGREVRFGAYGDPSAVPYEIWYPLAVYSDAYTGYTHQANHPNFDERMLTLCMVSVDTPKQALKTESRYFRVKTPESPLLENEIECLADSKGLTCKECLLCSGTNSRTEKKPNIVINVHGSTAKHYADKYGKANLITMENV
jgi:hypothetical protein